MPFVNDSKGTYDSQLVGAGERGISGKYSRHKTHVCICVVISYVQFMLLMSAHIFLHQTVVLVDCVMLEQKCSAWYCSYDKMPVVIIRSLLSQFTIY